MINNFQQKTILITGATRGLGEYLAKQFWYAGANLILIARSSEKLNNIKQSFLHTAKSQQKIEIIPLDLADQIAVERFVKSATNKKIDILINNAAIQGPVGPVWENDWQKWQETLQVNLLAPIALCRMVIPAMQKTGHGKIINLSGGGATNARPNFSAYAVAKSGLVRFSETLAEEVKEYNITINCIAPGKMTTQLNNSITYDETTFHPATHLCFFLASNASDTITGKLISAVWDKWQDIPNYVDEIKNSDIYTLRRIIPRDRGKEWGDL